MTTEPTDTHHCSPAAEPLALSSSEVLGPTPPLVERLRDWADDTYELQAGELPDVRRDLAAAADEIERLRAEAASFHMAYRLTCDDQTKAQAVEINRLRAALLNIVAAADMHPVHLVQAIERARGFLGPNGSIDLEPTK